MNASETQSVQPLSVELADKVYDHHKVLVNPRHGGTGTLWIAIEGHEDFHGDNQVVAIDFSDDGRVELLVWDDPSREDPRIIDLSKTKLPDK